MIAPKPNQILNNITALEQLRLNLFVDYDNYNKRLSEFECFPVDFHQGLQDTLLTNFFSCFNLFGAMQDEDGTVLCQLTMSVDVREFGYVLYFKYNPTTKKVDIYSVNDDFLSFMKLQHSVFIKEPAKLVVDKLTIADIDQYLFDLDVEHKFSRSVRQSETALEVRLSGFGTDLHCRRVNVSEGLVDLDNLGLVSATLLDDSHVFSAAFTNLVIKKYIIHSNNDNAGLVINGSSGLSILYVYSTGKCYVLNKLITSTQFSGTKILYQDNIC